MNIFRRSYLSIIDKRKRNVILLSVFFVLFVILFVVFFAYVSTENQISFIQKSLDSMIMVHKENVEDSGICSFTDDDIESIKESDNVKAVNLLTYHEMELQNLTPYSENVELTGEYDEAMKRVMESLGMSAYKEPDSQAFAVTSSEDSAFFTGSGFYLSKGKPITAEDEGKNVVLISEEIASLNHLTVGDTVEIKLPYMDRSMGMSSTSLNLKVKGIFHWESISESPKSRTASPGNFLFIPADLLRANYALYPAIVYVYSEDGFLLDDTVKGLQDKLGGTSIDQDQQQGRFVYKWDTSWGKEIGESLVEVRKVTAVILLFFVLGILIIIGIISALVIREKRYEIAVYRGLGENKIKILGQFLIEMMSVILLAAALAGIVSVSVAPVTNNMIAAPYNKIVETKLDAQKDEKLFKDNWSAAPLSKSLYDDNAYLKNSNKNLDFRLQAKNVVFIIVILFVIPIIIMLMLLLEMRKPRRI